MGSDVPAAYQTELNRLLDQYRAVLEQDPQNPQILVDMANVLLKLERTDDAMGRLRMAAWVYFNREQYEDAIATCGRVFRFRPVDTEAKQLVDEVRKGRLMDDRAIEGALRLGRSRRVSERQVVVLSGQVDREDVTVPQTEWDKTAERRLPTPAPTDATPEADLRNLRAHVLAPRVPPVPTAESPTDLPIAETPTLLDADEEDLEPRDPDEPTTTPAGQPARSGLAAGSTIALELARGAERRRFPRGAVLLAEDDRCDTLMVVDQGRVGLSKRGKDLEVLSPGGFVGELALLGDGVAHVTYRAVDPCEVLLFGGDMLSRVMEDPSTSKALRRSYRDRLQQMALRVSPMLAPLQESDARELFLKSRPLRAKGGQVVVRQGAPSSGLYLVLLGRLALTDLSEEELVLERLGDGDHFGEIALLDDIPEPAAVTARGFCQLIHLAPAQVFRFVQTRPDLYDHLRAGAEERKRHYEELRRAGAPNR